MREADAGSPAARPGLLLARRCVCDRKRLDGGLDRIAEIADEVLLDVYTLLHRHDG